MAKAPVPPPPAPTPAPPALVALVLATRPWSLPASLVPSLLAVALVRDRVTSAVDAVAPIVLVVAFHLGAAAGGDAPAETAAAVVTR